MAMRDDNSIEYCVAYNAKDLILYALSIGMGSGKDDADDLKFLYERHPKFTAVPTFCLALTFWADKGVTNNTTTGIPPFPPPLMRKEGVIPQRFLRGDDVDLSRFPAIHTWQSIVWDRRFPAPPLPQRDTSRYESSIHSKIDMQAVSVVPKSIGTFVTSQSKVVNLDSKTNKPFRICTMQSTALVLGISKENVIAYQSGTKRLTSNPSIPDDQPPILEWTYPTISSQALLYRIASGDSNRIHVDASASEMLGSDKKAPLLHGLFTLAIAFRAIQRVANDSAEESIRKLEGKFTQPAFVGDALTVRVWKDKTSPPSIQRYFFVVVNEETGVTLLDCGCAELELRDHHAEMSRSKL